MLFYPYGQRQTDVEQGLCIWGIQKKGTDYVERRKNDSLDAQAVKDFVGRLTFPMVHRGR